MMLWDIIRDFFVQNIFGGATSDGRYIGGFLGVFTTHDFLYSESDTSNFYIDIGGAVNGTEDYFVKYVSMGDWLSTTATIIVLIALCFFLFLLVRYIFKLFSGLFAH